MIAVWVPTLLRYVELDGQAVVNAGVTHPAEARSIGARPKCRNASPSCSHGVIRPLGILDKESYAFRRTCGGGVVHLESKVRCKAIGDRLLDIKEGACRLRTMTSPA